MQRNKRLSLLIAVMMVVTIFCAAPQATAASQLNDINGHWAQGQIQSMSDKEIIAGYPDNTFKPDNTITRAEFITLTNRAFSFKETAQINYSDVSSSDWFAPEIAKAKAAGYIAGYEDGTMKPNAEISRQEVAKIMATILKLDISNGVIDYFSDYASIPAWSKDYIAAMVKGAYMNGYPDGTFQPTKSLTRAEAAVTLSRTLGVQDFTQTVFDKAGTYGPETGTQTIKANLTIKADGVTLQNLMINGDLVIDASVGNGTVTLKNVTVTGNTIIKGGAKVVLDHSVLNSCTVNNPNNVLDLQLINSPQIAKLVLDSAANVKGTGVGEAVINVKDVTMQVAPAKVTVKQGLSANIGGKTVYGGGGGSSGGGGGSSDVTVSTINVTLLNSTKAVASNGVTFDLSNAATYPNATAVSQLSVTTTPTEAIAGATLTISQITTRGINFLSTPITTTTTNGSVTIADLLGGLAADNDVSLGALRTIFGSGDIIVTGKLSKTGYIFNSGADMTITIKLGAGDGNAVINNSYVKIEKTGVGTATVTINNPTATVGDLRGTGFNFASVIASVVSGSAYTEGTITDDFKATVESLINAGAFDTLTLGQLIGKTVTFRGYTVSFVAAVPVTSITVTGAGNATTISTNGGTLQMSAAVLPVDAGDKAVIWSVIPGTGTATISAGGLLTATWNGTVTVKATARDGSGVSGSLDITITGQVADKTALIAAITAAQAKHDAAVEGTNPGQYTVGSKTTLLAAITAATTVKDNASATPSQVSEAVTTLNDAVSTFEASKVGEADKTELNAAITAAQAKHDAAAEGTDPGQYASGSKATLQAAITAATTVKENALATAGEVSAAVTALDNAVKAFEAGKVAVPVTLSEVGQAVNLGLTYGVQITLEGLQAKIPTATVASTIVLRVTGVDNQTYDISIDYDSDLNYFSNIQIDLSNYTDVLLLAGTVIVTN